jgi:DNA-binding transcriptional regulator GbsR (MarR family)
MGRIDDLESAMFLLWEDMAEARGFDRILGRIICTLLIAGSPLSQREIAEKTGYSVPTISRSLKTLVSLGSVRKARKAGTRTRSYYVEMHPSDMLRGALAKWLLTAKTMARRTRAIHEELENARDENPDQAERLMTILREFAELIPRLVDAIENAMKDSREG